MRREQTEEIVGLTREYQVQKNERSRYHQGELAPKERKKESAHERRINRWFVGVTGQAGSSSNGNTRISDSGQGQRKGCKA